MKRKKSLLCLAVLVLLLSGCSMGSASKMYCLPKRSELYADVQKAVNDAMSGLEYCAPRSGEYQQPVQMEDLDGDGRAEYLVFTKGNAELPLKILIFDEVDGQYQLVDTIESGGASFDLVLYAQMDEKPGLELIVGHHLSNQVPGSVTVYSFGDKHAQSLLKTNYSKILTTDLDMDSKAELMVLRAGESETDNGVAVMYGIENGIMARTNEVHMSAPMNMLLRIVTGNMDGQIPAVYIASELDDFSLITDVLTYADGSLVNASVSNESGTSMKTIRNYFVYADDIDNDGVVELPDLKLMQTCDEVSDGIEHNIIRWYAMKPNGEEVDKMYTYNEFNDGWYLELNKVWANRLTVKQTGNEYAFYILNENYEKPQKVLTIYVLSGQNREAVKQHPDWFMLLKTDFVTYAASIEFDARYYGITSDSLVRNFHLIQRDWNTGET